MGAAMTKKCHKVPEVMAMEIEVIKKHINNHKYYNNILSDEDAIVDFINKYAWVMREAVCAFCSDIRCECSRLNPDSEMPDLALYAMICKSESDAELSLIELMIIKKHINNHKWYNGIPTYLEAISDFLGKYGWIIKELKKAQSKIS